MELHSLSKHLECGHHNVWNHNFHHQLCEISFGEQYYYQDRTKPQIEAATSSTSECPLLGDDHFLVPHLANCMINLEKCIRIQKSFSIFWYLTSKFSFPILKNHSFSCRLSTQIVYTEKYYKGFYIDHYLSLWNVTQFFNVRNDLWSSASFINYS